MNHPFEKCRIAKIPSSPDQFTGRNI